MASFQRAVVAALLRRLKQSAQERAAPQPAAHRGASPPTRCCGARRANAAEALGLPLFVPPIALSTDNAAMIGAAGFVAYRKGVRADWTLNARAPPRLSS